MIRPTIVRIGSWILFMGAVITLGVVWVTPLEVIVSRAAERAGTDPFAQFEAMGQAEALTWLLRTTMPVGLVLFWPSRGRADRVSRWLTRCAAGLRRATRAGSGDRSATPAASAARGWLLRAFVLAWAGLAVLHLGFAVDQRTRDWSYYRLNGGSTVLPNISESNRMVIRYLSQATPEDARILILSDQKLYFVSYYLLPRRIYHPMHPDAEFVIPEPDQQRPLPAYQLADLDDAWIDRIQPDYVLEYFEGPGYVDRERLLEDTGWISFARALRSDASYVPAFNVVLRRWGREDAAP